MGKGFAWQQIARTATLDCGAGMDIPETYYAGTLDGAHIAYQVVGTGQLDLIFVPSFANPIDLMWHMPPYARFLSGLAGFARLICFDKRGSGRSAEGPDPTGAALEAWMDDISVVMDAVGSERATLLGFDAGGMLAMLFAASFPERTAALVLAGTSARVLRNDDDDDSGMSPERVTSSLESFERSWGTGDNLRRHAPSLADDPQVRRWWGMYERAGNGPGPATKVVHMLIHSDVRHVLSAIRVPTLVIHRTDDRRTPVARGRYLADHIPDARLTEMPGEDHLLWAGDQDQVLSAIEEFHTGAPRPVGADRVLATVMFTDLVESTVQAAALGDARWKAILDEHDALVRRQVERFRGRHINTTGDGIVATFDGPARGVRCAQAICEGLRALGIEVRAGLHCGEVELRGDDIGGIAVHIGQRVSALARPGEVLVSRTVTDLVAGSGLQFEERGEHELKGVPGRWAIYAVRE